jgi:hypothetical protein
MLGTFFIILAAVVLAGGLMARTRIRRTVEGDAPVVTDEVLRRILEEGEVPPEEVDPLDEEEIREAEDRFWEEEWDEPEEF